MNRGLGVLPKGTLKLALVVANGNLKVRLADWEGALEDYSYACRMGLEDQEALEWEDSESCRETVVAIDEIILSGGVYEDLLKVRSQMRIRLKDYEGAEKDLEQALSEKQEDTQLWYLRGVLRVKNSEPKLA